MRLNKSWIVALIATIAVIATAALAWNATRPLEIVLHANDASVVAEGAAIYQKHCAVCHGKALEGQPNWRRRDADGMLPAPPHDETGHTWHHPDLLLFELTKYGAGKRLGEDYKTNMPTYDRVLTDRQILAVLSYIKSTWPKPIRDRHDRLNEAVRVQ